MPQGNNTPAALNVFPASVKVRQREMYELYQVSGTVKCIEYENEKHTL